MHAHSEKIIALESNSTSFIININDSGPSVLYWGEKIAASTATQVVTMHQRNMGPGTASKEVPILLCPTHGSGFMGQHGLSLHRSGHNWDMHLSDIHILEQTAQHVIIKLSDSNAGVSLQHNITLDKETDVLICNTSVTNNGADGLTIDWCNAGTLALPSFIDQVTGFHGRWANEFQTHKTDLNIGVYLRENLRGRTSHDSFPGLVAHTKNTTEQNGPAYGFHLGWSGNHRIAAEKMFDGRSFVQMGEKLIAGEVILPSGASYCSPKLYAAFSTSGFSSLSQKFHRFVRTKLLTEEVRKKPRPVHYNTWEAVYFNHDTLTLQTLADKAAEVGAERFVLDDGWFSARRDDTAGLGDWFVDHDVYPEGLHPLIDHVLGTGMEFGLWVEPEMVNPNSDLYRNHPDWILKATDAPHIRSRNQLVLDLTKEPVREYLYERIDSLLSEYKISYLKWDMNRDIHHPGSDGVAANSAQTHALYALLKRLREKHPTVEIESCSSGGARIDYGILAHTDRVWTSDSNDALDRLNIQRGISFFFPSNVMGSHVGPRDCHITRRILSMDLRAATAIFGHMGMELNLTELTSEETETLKTAISLYKKNRDLLHSGNHIRLDTKDHASAFAVVSECQNEAVFSYTQIKTCDETAPETLFFIGINHEKSYTLDLIWPLGFTSKTAGDISRLNGHIFSGDVLSKVGLQLPHMHPETALVFMLKAID